LGILNLLPIPALDGGHIMFNLYEAIFKKELNEEIMYKLTIAGWVLLGSLMLIGIYNDLQRLFF
jgi:regulator of sigma E protease